MAHQAPAINPSTNTPKNSAKPMVTATSTPDGNDCPGILFSSIHRG